MHGSKGDGRVPSLEGQTGMRLKKLQIKETNPTPFDVLAHQYGLAANRNYNDAMRYHKMRKEKETKQKLEAGEAMSEKESRSETPSPVLQETSQAEDQSKKDDKIEEVYSQKAPPKLPELSRRSPLTNLFLLEMKKS